MITVITKVYCVFDLYLFGLWDLHTLDTFTKKTKKEIGCSFKIIRIKRTFKIISSI